ncbi:hypothetical protein [Lactobacillus delbrueckii]|uniref:hypothetical protein n=1 Tax=Lactobacillus delbrueckii TaxID=1584 RepID=UPI003A8AD3AC
MIVIPFKNEVRGDAVDINLKSKLMKEKEFILKWCIEGVAKWQARDGKALYHPKYQPAAVEEATAGLWNSAHVPVDSIKQWLENGNYEEGHSSTPPKVKEVYEDYLAYCKEHELKVPSAYTKQGFNKELARRGHHKRPGTGNSYVWISLKKRG